MPGTLMKSAWCETVPTLFPSATPNRFERTGKKLVVARANACMFHYGYVRNPALMRRRNAEVETTYRGTEEAAKLFTQAPDMFDFGPLNKRALFRGTRPESHARSYRGNGLETPSCL